MVRHNVVAAARPVVIKEVQRLGQEVADVGVLGAEEPDIHQSELLLSVDGLPFESDKSLF